MGEEEKTYLKHPLFPNSENAPFEITSPESPAYNCLAWVLGQTETWWEPEEGCAWPPEIPPDNNLQTVQAFFEASGFELCAGATPEPGFTKIAIFSDGNGQCTHAAKLMPDERWTSKLGESFDVVHTLYAIEAGIYGAAKVFLKRRNG